MLTCSKEEFQNRNKRIIANYEHRPIHWFAILRAKPGGNLSSDVENAI